MKLILTVFSTLTLVGTGLADPNTLAFTTWPCNNCAADGGGGSCPQINHQNVGPNVCHQLEPGQQSLRVDDAQGPLNCFLELFSTPNCQGNGPTFGYEPPNPPCKPIPANERLSYIVHCQ